MNEFSLPPDGQFSHQTPRQRSQAENFVHALISFPLTLVRNVIGVLYAVLIDWDTLILVVGAGLIAYATGEYVLVGGALLLLYALVRIFGSMFSKVVGDLAQHTSLYGRIIRDNPPREQPVAITQLPAVFLTSPAPASYKDEADEAGDVDETTDE